MANWIALLRGINVGGKNVLRMQDLARDLGEIGCSCVKTYIQSGNVVFRHPEVTASKLATLIEQTISARHQIVTRAHILSARDLASAVARNPFPAATSDPKSLHVFFFAQKPKPAKISLLDGVKADSETYAVKGNVLYLHSPDGMARSKLAARAESILGISTTARNWRTTVRLLAMASDE